MWKAFAEMVRWGWLPKENTASHRRRAADGCARSFAHSAPAQKSATPWENPTTHAAGLEFRSLGDRLVLRALRESGGEAESASEDAIRRDTRRLAEASGIDAAPEGGCALAVTRTLVQSGPLPADVEWSSTIRAAGLLSLRLDGQKAFATCSKAGIARLRRIVFRAVPIAILDPFSGISGDMTLGALVDLG
jgi:threonine synthase